MPNIKLPDGKEINFDKPITGLDIAEKISKSLAKQANVISVNDELKKSQLYTIKNNQNSQDFILCTDIKDYEKLKNGPFNIVLQNKMVNNNNGSLSWAALEHGVRYINIETRLGWLSQQKKMLYYVESLLK